MATPVYCRDIYAFLSIRGRINFLQLARYGKYHESTYRMGFERDFDFLTFNILLVEQYCGANCILVLIQPI
ncbi:MAG: hypothetical protein IPL46_26910 [Saprospiraceae bacterium]|nr:hypothetical protein [Saprospiraceae bacterium]